MRYFLMVLVLSVMVVGCTKETTPQVQKEPDVQVQEESLAEKVLKVPDMATALAMTAPEMGNRRSNISSGTAIFATWAMKHMSYKDVFIGVRYNETSFGLAMKDIDEARGKRMCIPGSIIELEIMKLLLGKMGTGKIMDEDGNIYKIMDEDGNIYNILGKMGTGKILGEDGNIYNILTVRSTGTLVERDDTVFCGVVTEKYSYTDTQDTTRHALTLVGMFGLPENIY